MELPDMNFIKAVHAVEVDGDVVDAIELFDGRVIAIDGETATLFADLEALLDSEDDDEDVERLAIAL